MLAERNSKFRNQIPVVVAGGDINGLGLARSLARAGIPTAILDTNVRYPVMRTRHGRKVVVQALEGEIFIAELLRLRQNFATDPVLFLTQEASVATVAKHYDEVSRAYRFSIPEAALLEPLMDKARFQKLAENFGFPIPHAVRLGSGRNVADARNLSYPCVLKPVVKSPAYDQRFKKAYKVEDFAELTRLVEKIGDVAEMIAQEWIEGGDSSIYFCLQYRSRDQRTIASFTGRKLRSWPPRVGGTASCVPAPEEAPVLTSMTDAFFKAVGFFGIGSMEYKKASATGKFYMIEPTVGRTDFQEEIATLNGVNIPVAAYTSELGLAIGEPSRGSKPAAWAVSPLDRWSRELQPADGPRFPPGLRIYDAVRRLDDPLPWCCAMLERTAGFIRKLNRRNP